MLDANEVGSVKSSDKLIGKYKKLSKIRKLLKDLNYLNQEIWKAKNYSSFKNQLNQKKNYQKIEIYLILILKKTGQAI